MAGSRVRLAFEKVLRFGGAASRTRRNSAPWTESASQMSFRLSACAARTAVSAAAWLVTAIHRSASVKWPFAREATASLKTTLATANGSMAKIDRDVVDRLPALMDQLEATVGKLDSVAGNANAMIAENRPALQSFANEGLSQMGPTLAELRALIRDLRRVTDRLDGGPARYILGRDAPKEFEPK